MTKVLDVPPTGSAARILDTALDLFAVKGYDATPVREICEAAGITKPTLYHFYGNKEGVFQALLRTGFDHYQTLVAAAIAGPGSFQSRMKTLTRAVFDSARTRPRFWRFVHSVIWAPPGTAPSQSDRCIEFYDGVVADLGDAADAAVRAGELHPGDTPVRMTILMGAISETATGYVIAGKPQLTPELADRLVDEIFHGWVA